MAQHITYGVGGFDPDAADHNIIAVTDDGQPDPPADPLTPQAPTPDLAAEVASLTARVDGFAGLAVTLATLSGVPEEQAQAIVAEAVGGQPGA